MFVIGLSRLSAIMMLAFMASLSGSCAGQTVKKETVSISNEHPRITVNPMPRRMSIELRMAVDRRGKYVVPGNLDATFRLLSSALPDDFVDALAKDDDIYIYANSDYGMSVVDDLDAFFSLAWKLRDGEGVCAEAHRLMEAYTPGSCFVNILYLYKLRGSTHRLH